MKPLFYDKYLEDLFLDLENVNASKKKLQKLLSFDVMLSIKRIYENLLIVDNFYFLVVNHVSNCESLVGNYSNCYSLVINKNYRLIIKPNSLSLEPDVLKCCKEFYLIGVVDYHGSKETRILP